MTSEAPMVTISTEMREVLLPGRYETLMSAMPASTGDGNGGGHGQIEWLTQIDVECDHGHPAQHDKLPLGEVDDVGGVVDQANTHGHQGVHAPGVPRKRLR